MSVWQCLALGVALFWVAAVTWVVVDFTRFLREEARQ